MRMYDLIKKKREGATLTREEWAYMIREFVGGAISDYQMSAFLMAAFIRGLSEEEIVNLTDEMARSGDMIDLSAIEGIKVDKHSTGGVGDKTTFLVGPIVAACGGKVAKMSGRGLGHTGGTVDKMESIPHIRSTLAEKEFIDIVNRIGLCVIGQTGELAPADKMIYALRDVTATVDSIPLIAASIMSKKIASGADAIVLDVKVGSGAFMKHFEDALTLAKMMVHIGAKHHRKVLALLTNMDRPLGYAIGNALEIKEVLDTLKGNGPDDLVEEVLTISAHMLHLSEKGDFSTCKQMAAKALQEGKALEKFRQMIDAQGGDTKIIDEPERLPQANYSGIIYAERGGYIAKMNTEKCGIACTALGAGRMKKDDVIDYGAGILMHKKTGDFVLQGEALATLYTNEESRLDEAMSIYKESLTIKEQKPDLPPSILAKIDEHGRELYISVEEYERMLGHHDEESHRKSVDSLENSRIPRVVKNKPYTSELGIAMDKVEELASQQNSRSEMDLFLEQQGLDETLIKWLIDRAIEAKSRAYVPYSKFAVGAVLLAKDGNLYKGCNIENASYGLTNCAERTAIFSAIANQSKTFKALAIVSDAEEVCSPCGACRQVILEFSIPVVIMANSQKQYKLMKAEDLLPQAFQLNHREE